jgi:RNA polymerase sigma factor (sigma-70 family)
MRSRDRLIEQFSTFALLEDDRFCRWIDDPRLQRSMKQQVANTTQPDVDERRWAAHWHRQYTKHPLAQSHLTAYLQEVCFWVAREMTSRLRSTQYTLADFFQIANSEIPKVFKSFTADRGGSFKTYAKLIITNALKDLLRQRQAADVCSDWSLLRKVSKKRIGEVLLHRGVVEPDAAQYQFAWFCFKTLYVPSDNNSQKLPPPDARTWQAIGELYNTKRQDQLLVPGAMLSAAQIEVRITKLAQWTRAYLYPSIDSLNRNKPESGEIQDDLTQGSSESLLDDAIDREEIDQRTAQQAALNQTLTQSLANLSPEFQEILQLFYQEGLSQQELSSRLELSQPTVSRRIKKAEAKLLEALLIWIEAKLHKIPDPNELKSISTMLKEWLINRNSV